MFVAISDNVAKFWAINKSLFGNVEVGSKSAGLIHLLLKAQNKTHERQSSNKNNIIFKYQNNRSKS